MRITCKKNNIIFEVINKRNKINKKDTLSMKLVINRTSDVHIHCETEMKQTFKINYFWKFVNNGPDSPYITLSMDPKNPLKLQKHFTTFPIYKYFIAPLFI